MNKNWQVIAGIGIGSAVILMLMYLMSIRSLTRNTAMMDLSERLKNTFELDRVYLSRFTRSKGIEFQVVFTTKIEIERQKIQQKIEEVGKYLWNQTSHLQPFRIKVVYIQETGSGCSHHIEKIEKEIVASDVSSRRKTLPP